MGDAEHQPVDTPPVRAGVLLGTRGVNPDGSAQDPEPVDADSAFAVPSTSLRIRFDRFLLPSSVSRQALCLRPDLTDVPGPAECAGGVFVQTSYDPVRREVTLRQEPGARLALDTVYKLTLFVPASDGDCTGDNLASCGIRAFDRAPLDEVYTYTFRTSETDPAAGIPGGALDETPPPAVFCGTDGVADSLGNSCTYARCHSSGGSTGAAMGLDFTGINLGKPDQLEATAINRVAHGTQMGEDADDPEETPARFGRAMPVISAPERGVRGSPGDSYIMYKLLTGTSVANAPADIKPSDEEIERLRASVVVGMPMPVTDPATTPLTPVQLLNLSHWIARGAPTPACP